PARARETIVLRVAMILRRAPLALDPSLLLEALERGVERSLIDVEHTPRELLDALADAPAVHRLERQCLEDEQIERSAENVGGRIAAGRHRSSFLPLGFRQKMEGLPVGSQEESSPGPVRAVPPAR